MQNEGIAHPERSNSELPRNVAEVERPWAHFRIAYAEFDITKPTLPHHRTLKTEDVKGSDAIFLEQIFEKSDLKTVQEVINWQEQNGQYTEILKYAKQNDIPIYYADLDVFSDKLFLQQILTALEGGASVVLLVNSIVDWRQKLTRRAVVKGLAATWLGSSIVGAIPYYRDTIIADLKKLLVNANETAHPETTLFLTQLRNYVLAHKMEQESYRFYRKNGKKPIITCVIGGAHVGIEKALNTDPEERIRIIQSILNGPGGGEFKKGISSIAKLTPDPNSESGWAAEITSAPDFFNAKVWQERK